MDARDEGRGLLNIDRTRGERLGILQVEKHRALGVEIGEVHRDQDLLADRLATHRRLDERRQFCRRGLFRPGDRLRGTLPVDRLHHSQRAVRQRQGHRSVGQGGVLAVAQLFESSAVGGRQPGEGWVFPQTEHGRLRFDERLAKAANRGGEYDLVDVLSRDNRLVGRIGFVALHQPLFAGDGAGADPLGIDQRDDVCGLGNLREEVIEGGLGLSQAGLEASQQQKHNNAQAIHGRFSVTGRDSGR